MFFKRQKKQKTEIMGCGETKHFCESSEGLKFRKNSTSSAKMSSSSKRDYRKMTVERLEHYVEKGRTGAKKEMAKRLLEGKGVEKNEARALTLLNECVAGGDSDAMLILAKCCAYGRGMERDAGQAQRLIAEAAKQMNNKAQDFHRLISNYGQQECIDLAGLWKCCFSGHCFYCSSLFTHRNAQVLSSKKATSTRFEPLFMYRFAHKK